VSLDFLPVSVILLIVFRRVLFPRHKESVAALVACAKIVGEDTDKIKTDSTNTIDLQTFISLLLSYEIAVDTSKITIFHRNLRHHIRARN